MIHIATAPCCWGVDDPNNPHLPPWQRVFAETAAAGYTALELGPYGYLPRCPDLVGEELRKNGLSIIAGTIFDRLTGADATMRLRKQVDDICSLVTALPPPPPIPGQRRTPPYLVLIDWGYDDRDYSSGHPDRARRLDDGAWKEMAATVRELAQRARDEHGVRAVIHPHAGGHIEFADEIERIASDIAPDDAGLCLDTGHLYYANMDPVAWLRAYAGRLDYLHFKDIDRMVHRQVMSEKIRFFDACAKGVMCPIGEGVIPYAEIRRLLDEIGYQGFIAIEQERDPRNVDGSLNAVRKSLAFLQRNGY
jgi:inosose dehydratase